MRKPRDLPGPGQEQHIGLRKSRAIAVSAIASFILGGLFLCLSCVMVAMVASTVFDLRPDIPPRIRASPSQRHEGVIVIVPATLIPALIGVLLILSGVGLLKRYRWSRTLALGVGGFLGLGLPLSCFAILFAWLNGEEIVPEDRQAALWGGIVTLINGVYAVLIYGVLLRKSIRAEFERPKPPVANQGD